MHRLELSARRWWPLAYLYLWISSAQGITFAGETVPSDELVFSQDIVQAAFAAAAVSAVGLLARPASARWRAAALAVGLFAMLSRAVLFWDLGVTSGVPIVGDTPFFDHLFSVPVASWVTAAAIFAAMLILTFPLMGDIDE